MTRKIRPIRIEGNIAYVPLTLGYEATIDASDVAAVGEMNWHAKVDKRSDGSVRAVYAVHSGNRLKVKMHRLIVKSPNGVEVDHVNGNGLDNRKINLRYATASENRRNQKKRVDNTSGVKGVVWVADRHKWVAQIYANGRRTQLGYFAKLEEAKAAYSQASINLHGEFSRIE